MKFKKFWQLFLLVIDINIFVLPVFFFSLYIQPIPNILSVPVDIFERYTCFLIIHQIIAFTFSKNSLDVRKDALLLFKTTLELLLIYMECPVESIKTQIIKNIEWINEPGTIAHKDIKNAMLMLKNYFNFNTYTDEQISLINAELVNANHQFEFLSLSWQNTIFLKHLK